jgi:hypothetical protein
VEDPQAAPGFRVRLVALQRVKPCAEGRAGQRGIVVTDGRFDVPVTERDLAGG